MAICPHCNREVPDDAALCPYCGAQLREDIAICGNCGSVIPAEAKICPVCGVELADTVKCPRCGHEIPATAKSCPNCGYRFDKDEEPVKIEYEPTPVPRGEYATQSAGVKEKTPEPKTIPPQTEKSRFWTGFAVGFVVALLITSGILAFGYIMPLQKENKELQSENINLQEQLNELRTKYTALSLKYNSTVLNYSTLNQQYLQEVARYNSLLANYTQLYGTYKNLTNFEDEKFIVVLFFTTDYGNKKYWLYLEIDPQVYLHYKMMPHLPGTSQYMEEFKDYVVVDNITQTIVDAVKSKLVSTSDEELADALLSLVQNKITDGTNGAVYENLDNVPGTYYLTDTPAKYPVETLILRSGECLDDSIFYLSLLKTAGFKSGFLFIPPQGSMQSGHAMVILNLTSGEPTHTSNYNCWRGYTEINGVRYYPAETTFYGCLVGESGLDLSSLETYPLLIN